jgi:hypothetical protein
LRTAIFVALVSLGATACGGEVKEEAAPPAETAAAVRNAVLPVTLDRAQLARLKWIEGSWRGTGDSTAAFYERYSFPDDSTMVSITFRDSALQAISDSSVYMLRDGQFGNGGTGARWVATAMDETSIHFEPIARARNNFTWKRVSADEWSAVLETPAGEGRPASSRTYTMRRIK